MNRDRANQVLAAVFVIFIAAAGMRWLYRDAFWSQALFRMAEAALVGGVADWFAVTALFQRPLGISFHTAIIPRNRQKIITSITYMVEEELLSRESILRHLQNVKIVPLIIRWMDRGGKDDLLRLSVRVFEGWLRNADRKQLTAVLAAAIRSQLQSLQLHSFAQAVWQWLVSSGNANKVFDLILAEAQHYAAGPSVRQKIYHILDSNARAAAGSGTVGRVFGSLLRTFGFIDLEEAAYILHQRLQAELRELERPDHSLRVWLFDRLNQSLVELEHNSQWQNAVKEWKDGIIDRLPLELFIQSIIDGLFRYGEDGRLNNSPPLIDGAARFTAAYWENFRQDLELQVWLERRLQEAAAEVALSEHKIIGELVKQALGSLSDQELNAFIEDKVGEDLAWIRINGSVVGAVAGLAVFLFGQYLYLPYICPWLSTVIR